MHAGTVYQTDIRDLKLFARGKVRDIYDLGEELLIVATDRISAFDVVLPAGIPGKGKVLTALSLFWFDYLKDIVGNHLITADVARYPRPARKYAEELDGRSMLVRKANPFPVECVVRGYLSGSGWIEYRESGSVCGVDLPGGMRESGKLAEPIFTPATKEAVGDHDINISFEEMIAITGFDVASRLRENSLALYGKASEYAHGKGIIIADTKFEFGLYRDEVILIDEVLTPDSSRFWPASQYAPGRAQDSFDKQYVRDYLLTLDWDRQAPGPELPGDVIGATAEKYREALRIITGAET
ncbi:MAG: phosphoribosylaminoimidazolesuccinocarboxamide synthase [Deltaproteobacteria bacterium]|nr:phosphoribosylaminoimidazolesuccinocarboxamide synthase [Deltaproteobacteria bacterium]NIS76709.1 phosphoribosylaminoimidazolesuccinocarboxamide synthase [Deltaproteobacteria bacterium]